MLYHFTAFTLLQHPILSVCDMPNPVTHSSPHCHIACIFICYVTSFHSPSSTRYCVTCPILPHTPLISSILHAYAYAISLHCINSPPIHTDCTQSCHTFISSLSYCMHMHMLCHIISFTLLHSILCSMPNPGTHSPSQFHNSCMLRNFIAFTLFHSIQVVACPVLAHTPLLKSILHAW